MFAQVFEGIKLAIFDLDGTLIDSFKSWDQAYDEFARRHGIEAFDRPEFYGAVENDLLRDRSAWLARRYGLTQEVDAITREYADIFYEKYFKPEYTYDGAVELLNLLRSRGIIVAICTAGDPGNKRIFDDLGFEPDLYLSCEDVGVSKPDPAVYFAAMKHFGVDRTGTVIFEDSLRGLSGARATGSRVVAMLAEQSEGKTQEREEAADMSIMSWRELLE